jgi:hypothetical protein
MVSISSIKSKKGGDKGGVQKQVRFKLKKEQKIYVEDLVRLDNRIVVCREYIAMWMKFFRFFAEDLSEKEITPAEEKAFFQTMSQLGRKHFLFVELMGDKFERGPDIIGVMGMAVSLAHIQNMPENTRSKLELDWHSLFLDMNKALGRLLRELPGNKTLAQALESIKDTQAVTTQTDVTDKKAKSSGLKSKVLAAILALPPFGILGLHCFYMKAPKRAPLRIVTVGLLSLYDLVLILSGKMTDGEGRQLI